MGYVFGRCMFLSLLSYYHIESKKLKICEKCGFFQMFYPGRGGEDSETYVALTNFRYEKTNQRLSLSCFPGCLVSPTFAEMWVRWSAT